MINKNAFIIARQLRFIVACLLFCFAAQFVQAQQAAPTNDYKFKLGITYNITSGANGNMNNMKMWFSENGYTGVEPGGNNAIFLVMDIPAQKMYTIIEPQKMMMAMDMKSLQQSIPQMQQHGVDTAGISKAQFTKTGVTEKILGYNCDQYKITSDNSESLLWATTELGEGFADMAKSLMMALNKGRQGGANLPDTKGALNGVMLKIIVTELSTKKVTTIEATEINKDGKEVNTTGYQMMNMPAGMGNMMQ